MAWMAVLLFWAAVAALVAAECCQHQLLSFAGAVQVSEATQMMALDEQEKRGASFEHAQNEL
jgi:hypothetical protein